MANNYSSPQLTFRIFDDELALHVESIEYRGAV